MAIGYAKPLLILAFLLSQNTLYTQTLEENHSGSWLEFSGSNKIHEDWSIPISGIIRHHELFEVYDFSFIRTGLSYRLNDAATLTGGVAYVNSKSYQTLDEITIIAQYWVYEEFSLKTPINTNKLSHRWRLENRWVHSNQETHFSNRARYRLQYVRPIHGKTFVKSFNEIFVNLKGTFFNQNRFYIGIGQELSSSLKVDVGYLKNHFKTSDFDAIRMGITFTTNFIRNEIAYFED